jgi:hypothetical protein
MKSFFAFILLASSAAMAEPNQWTATPPGARFEIVQSSLVARQTFKLDNATGRVWAQVTDNNGDFSWESVPVDGLPSVDKPMPRFQIFCSGMGARWCFLIDAWTGETWLFVTTADGGYKFEVMPDAP